MLCVGFDASSLTVEGDGSGCTVFPKGVRLGARAIHRVSFAMT